VTDDKIGIAPDAPISLKEAAETILRGLVTASTLRAAADRGELTIERLGRRVVTTPAAIAEWRKRCRVEADAPNSISRNDPRASPPNISETERSASPQDLANASIAALLENSPNTSRGRKPRHSGKATRTASRSQR